MPPAETQRYAMILDEGAQRGLERLRLAYKKKTKADVYELAIRVLTWASDQVANNYEVGRYSAAKDEFQPLLMPEDFDRSGWVSSGRPE